MNLASLIQQTKFKDMILLESYIYNDLSIHGKIVKPRTFASIQKEDIPYIQNMLTVSDYVLYKLRKGVSHLDKVDGETAVRLSELPSSIRDEVYQEAPNTRESDVFFLSYYGR